MDGHRECASDPGSRLDRTYHGTDVGLGTTQSVVRISEEGSFSNNQEGPLPGQSLPAEPRESQLFKLGHQICLRLRRSPRNRI
ncbi:hypothetical protein QR680_016637 [Steinernema hermaphroditum]|uniref:Uncharacterized protein n=1 Tax=Steinernema hermaphroditum TaxID=289476 RepID=A0AA39HCT8_9BILA|nr:hypothetical protein QR680_016637 [Steinernema hermaphroditum]